MLLIRDLYHVQPVLQTLSFWVTPKLQATYISEIMLLQVREINLVGFTEQTSYALIIQFLHVVHSVSANKALVSESWRDNCHVCNWGNFSAYFTHSYHHILSCLLTTVGKLFFIDWKRKKFFEVNQDSFLSSESSCFVTFLHVLVKFIWNVISGLQAIIYLCPSEVVKEFFLNL